MEMISTTEASKRKTVSRQSIINAVARGDLDGSKVGPRTLVVLVNEKFEQWKPNPIRRAAGLANRERLQSESDVEN
jgi:hypothetical protein